MSDIEWHISTETQYWQLQSDYYEREPVIYSVNHILTGPGVSESH